MYDNLKERLTDMSVLASSRTPADALKYIEELEAQNADLKAKLEKATQCFIKIILHCANFGRGVPSTDERIIERCEETAANALEYLAGGKDE